MKRLIIILLTIITSSICVCGQDIFEPARFFCNRNSTDFYTLNTGNYPTNFKLALRVRQLGSDRFALDFIAAEKVGSGLSSFELQDRRADINSIYGYSIFDTNGKVTSYAFNESNIVTINNYVYKIFSYYYIEPEAYYIQNNPSDYNKFLDTIVNRSIKKFNEKVEASDKIITLSTCTEDNLNRKVVHAKLISKTEIK